jgi:serine protease Do
MPEIPPMPPNVEFYNDRFSDLNGLAQGDYGPNLFSRQKKIGLKIQDTDEGGNVKIIDVEEGSAAEKAGLKKDDIITEIGGKKVTNTDEARQQLNPAQAKPAYPIKALRNGTEMIFDIKIPKKLKTADL